MTISIGYVWLALPLVMACGAAPSQTPLPIAVVPSSAPSASLGDAGGPPVLPPDVEGVASVAPPTDGSPCVLTATELGRVLVLRAKPGGVPFASLRARRVKATLLPSGGFFVEAETGALRVRGYVDTDDAVVLGAHPITFGGVVISTASTELRVVAATDGSIRAVPLDVGVTWNAPTDTPVACADLTLSALDVPAAPPKKMLAGHWRFREGATVAIAPDANAKPVAQVDPVDGDIQALEVRGARAHVEIASPLRIVTGWVAVGALRMVTSAAIEREEAAQINFCVISGMCLIPLSPPPPRRSWTITPAPVAAIEELTCPVDVRLLGDVSGTRTALGSVGAGAILRVLSREPPVAHVALANTAQGAFTPAAYETLLVSARDLATCAPQAITTDAPYVVRLASEEPPAPPKASGVHGVVAFTFISAGEIADAENVVRARVVAGARSCYRRALEAAPTASGKLVATLQVDRFGDVATVTTEPSGGLPKSIADCVAPMLRQLVFAPRPPGADRSPVSIALTFSLPP
jgi:hypothetical protein